MEILFIYFFLSVFWNKKCVSVCNGISMNPYRQSRVHMYMFIFTMYFYTGWIDTAVCFYDDRYTQVGIFSCFFI